MKKTIFISLFVIILVVPFDRPLGQALEEVSVEKILKNKELFHGKEVVVLGVVTKLKLKTSKAGKDYTTFSLKGEAEEDLKVFIWGHQNLKEGQKVRVAGIYRTIKKVGRYTFKNEIEASEIKPIF